MGKRKATILPEHPLTRWREARAISRRSLAARCGMDESVLRWVERGKGTTLRTALRLSAATQLPIAQFLATDERGA